MDNTNKELLQKELVGYIKEWMVLETSLQQMKKEMKTKSVLKKKLADKLIAIMKPNQIDRFDINGGNGSLVYKKNKTKKPLNKKTLLQILQSYYPSEPEMAENLSHYILENREETIKDTIKLAF